MTNRRVDGGYPMGTQPLPRLGSQPLHRTAPLSARTAPLSPTTPLPDGPRPTAQGDALTVENRPTAPLPQGSEIDAKRQELSDKKLRLTQLQVEMNSAEADIEKKKQEAEAQPLWKRAISGVAGFVGDRLQKIWETVKEEVSDLTEQISKLEQEIEDAAKAGAEIVSAGVKEFKESRGEGQGLLDSLKDAAGASGTKAMTDVIDPMLDNSVLGKDDEFQDKGVGALGPLITNRLGIGESVSIKIEAGATIPLQALGIPNAKIDGGGTLKISRVQKTDAKGNPITEPKDANGKPPTELKVTMELEGRAGASYSAHVGFDASVKAGGYEAGVKASAGAEAEAGLHGRVAFAFAFDPSDAKDMGVLTGMVKMAGTAGAEAVIPGVGPILAGKTLIENRELIEEFGRHLYSVDGEGGLYAQATASASAQLGIFKGESRDNGPEARDKDNPKTESTGNKAFDAGKAYAAGKIQEKIGEVEGSILEQLQLQIGSLSGALGGSGSVGGRVNFRTGERTLTVELDGKAQVSGSVLGWGKGAGAEGNRTVALTYAKDGSLKGVKLQEEMTKETFQGIRTTVEDIFGRPMNDGVIAQIRESDTVRVTYDLRPEEVAKVAGLMAKQGPVAGLGYATTRRIDKDTVMLKERSVLAVKRTAAEFKAGFSLSLGAQVGVRGGVTLAHEQETALTN